MATMKKQNPQQSTLKRQRWALMKEHAKRKAGWTHTHEAGNNPNPKRRRQESGHTPNPQPSGTLGTPQIHEVALPKAG